MKGATAEPFASTSRPPNIAITTKTGSSQYFLRTRRNNQNSFRNETIGYSELLLHGAECGCGRVTRDPVGLGGAIRLQPKGIVAEHPLQQADGDNDAVEQQRQHDRAYDGMKQKAELQPKSVEHCKTFRPQHSDERKRDGSDGGPPARLMRRPQQRQGRHKREDGGKNQPKRAV